MDKKQVGGYLLWIRRKMVDIKWVQKKSSVRDVDNVVPSVHIPKPQINKGKENCRKKVYTQKKKNLSTSYQQIVDKLRQPDKLSTPVDNFVDKKKENYPQGCVKNQCCGGRKPKCKKFKDLLDESGFFEYN